jgi:hypothetical protein
MMKQVLVFFLLVSSYAFAQKNSAKDGTPVFKVTGATDNAYVITPGDNYFFGGCANRIKIQAKDTSRIADISLSNGKIRKIGGRCMYEITDLVTGTGTLLSIFEKGPKGKKIAVKNKKYQVVDFPKTKLSGMACDSAAAALMLMMGKLTATLDEVDMVFPVIGFQMDIFENDTFKVEESKSDRLTLPMKNYVKKLNEGSIFTLRNIKYLMPDGKERIDPIFRLFVIKPKVYKLGF